MKFSRCSCVCVFWLASCLTAVTMATTSSTEGTVTDSGTTAASTYSSLSTDRILLSTSDSPITTSTGSNSSSSTPSNVSSSTQEDNSTSTTPTTQSSTTASTPEPIHCKNGTCAGNESSCLNDTITDTCMLTASDSCYQIVYTNETDSYYEVGCTASCEYLHEDTADVTKTTRCCKTNLCNKELLPDPDQENSAIQASVSCISVLLLLIGNIIFT